MRSRNAGSSSKQENNDIAGYDLTLWCLCKRAPDALLDAVGDVVCAESTSPAPCRQIMLLQAVAAILLLEAAPAALPEAALLMQVLPGAHCLLQRDR